MSPVAAQHSVQSMSHVYNHKKHGNKTDDACQDAYAVQACRSESDPCLLDIPRDGEGDQQTGVSVSVIHHLLRIHQQLSVHIFHRIGLKGYVHDSQPSNDETQQQEKILFLQKILSLPWKLLLQVFRREEKLKKVKRPCLIP